MNFFDDITKLESKEEAKEEPKEGSKEEAKEEAKEEPKEGSKGSKENNSYTELQAQITELKDMFKKFIEVNKGEENNDN